MNPNKSIEEKVNGPYWKERLGEGYYLKDNVFKYYIARHLHIAAINTGNFIRGYFQDLMRPL